MGTEYPSASRRPTPDRPGTPRSNRRTLALSADENRHIGGGGSRSNLHTVVLIDVATSANLDPRSQRRMRGELYAMVGEVVQYAGFNLESLHLTDTGDGFRFLFPYDVLPSTHVVDMFVLGLTAGLREHRQYVREATRIRMRIAFDLGLIEPHLQGWMGAPLIRVARLIEAEPLRSALTADNRLDLVAVVSDELFETALRQGYGYIGPSCFQAVRVLVKEFDGLAWLLTPGAAGMCGRCYGLVA